MWRGSENEREHLQSLAACAGDGLSHSAGRWSGPKGVLLSALCTGGKHTSAFDTITVAVMIIVVIMVITGYRCIVLSKLSVIAPLTSLIIQTRSYKSLTGTSPETQCTPRVLVSAMHTRIRTVVRTRKWCVLRGRKSACENKISWPGKWTQRVSSVR